MKKIVFIIGFFVFLCSSFLQAAEQMRSVSSLQLKVYDDINENSGIDGSDQLMAGVVLQLIDGSSNVIRTVTTNLSGLAVMTNVPYGTYTLKEIVPNGYTAVSPSGGTQVLVVNASKHTLEFLNLKNEAGDCCNSFEPMAGKTYWVSAWVREEHDEPVKNYSDTYVELEFNGTAAPDVQIHTTGEIIDGWQRIVGSFVMPAAVTDIDIHLVNDNEEGDAYFDDVRIHPFNSGMKSYVYDPETNFLSAELDDNNYATFYEYDNEGQLVRIKKETARGIMTIQETRSQ